MWFSGKDLGTNWNFVLALHLHKICQKQRVKCLQMFICEVLNHDIKGLVMKTSFCHFPFLCNFLSAFWNQKTHEVPKFLNGMLSPGKTRFRQSISAHLCVCVILYMYTTLYIYDLILASREMEADQFRVTMATKKAPGQPRLNEILSQI